MKGIILAAGLSKRLRPITDDKPKCLLEIKGKPLLQNILELFRSNGINDISIVTGYKKEKINYPDISYFENDDFLNNGILHGLMYARAKLEEAVKMGENVIISFSDIWYNDYVLKTLLKFKGDIAIVVDTDWADYYKGRTEHPVSEAVNVILDDNKKMLEIGKYVFTDNIPKENQGESIGLWKFTPEGTKIFLKHFDRLNLILKKTDPFQSAKEWQKSYEFDMFQEMIDQGVNLHCVLIQKNWMEFDTVQDFKRTTEEINE